MTRWKYYRRLAWLLFLVALLLYGFVLMTIGTFTNDEPLALRGQVDLVMAGLAILWERVETLERRK